MAEKEDNLCGLKRQNHISQLSGAYLKSIQSFEQGLRISQSILNARSYYPLLSISCD